MVPQVNVNVTFGNPPPWGPPGSTSVRYYYIPDIEVYYDIPSANFIYFNGRKWVYSDVLPVRYAYYDLSGGYKVLLTDYYGPKPFVFYKTHKLKYPHGYHGPPSRVHNLNNRFTNKRSKKPAFKPRIEHGNIAHGKANGHNKH